MEILDTGLTFKTGHALRSGSPKGIVLHHAAGSGSVETIHNAHKNLGWIGIGYHFYVRQDGSVYRGRPESWIGAHAAGFNNLLGICAEGNFQNTHMALAQKKAITELVAHLLGKYGDLKIYRHSDLVATACPGGNYPFDEIVAAAKAGSTEPVTQTKAGKKGAAVNIKVYELDRGCQGEAVKALQLLLIGWGYRCGEAGADGIFGDCTETAVKAYQRDHGLTADGIAGVKTMACLLGVAS